MQPQNKGPGMLWGQSYVLPMTWGGGGIWGAPFGRHAAPMAVSFVCQPVCWSLKLRQIFVYKDLRKDVASSESFNHRRNWRGATVDRKSDSMYKELSMNNQPQYY